VPKTKVQRLGALLPEVPRPQLRSPHFSHGCRTDPTRGQDKETAAAEFKEWWANLPSSDVTVFSDGSEQTRNGEKRVGYGYAIYQNGKQIKTGQGAINSQSHVFDAEAIGAWEGLQAVLRLPSNARQQRIWMCIDSTSVIWCLRGDASNSSQWAFHKCQDAMQTHDIRIKWSPGHTGIKGNEAADRLADSGALLERDDGPAAQPTVSGIRSVYRTLRREAQCSWWEKRRTKLSAWYKKWGLEYWVKPLPELDLSRPALHRFLALRSSHGDFSWYHKKFKHDDAKLTCSCGRPKDPEHLVRCRKTTKARIFKQWPQRPILPPSNRSEGLDYLSRLMATPGDFVQLLEVTSFYLRICTR
jgi:ribonuclease HI